MKISKYQLPADAPVYKMSAPLSAEVVSTRRLSGPESSTEILHVQLRYPQNALQFLEGQSIGIQPPGNRPGSAKPHKLRLYSIASARKGDDGRADSLALCVKRVRYTDPDSSLVEDGLASGYICDWQPGQQVLISGPTGREFVLPSDHRTNLLLLATGTGIAPFRAFLNHIYYEHDDWQGQIHLFYSARTTPELLYANETNNDLLLLQTRKGLHLHLSRSREDFDQTGNKIYVQHLLAQAQDTVWPMLQEQNCAVYLCGLKSMESGLDAVLTAIASGKGLDWQSVKQRLRQAGRWNVEVY
ncbi:MAG: hypothetical protein KDK39_14870 [Leptospiraceae bacterium]|nr:hypothetical protein [Leptospiraceae bacterium]